MIERDELLDGVDVIKTVLVLLGHKTILHCHKRGDRHLGHQPERGTQLVFRGVVEQRARGVRHALHAEKAEGRLSRDVVGNLDDEVAMQHREAAEPARVVAPEAGEIEIGVRWVQPEKSIDLRAVGQLDGFEAGKFWNHAVALEQKRYGHEEGATQRAITPRHLRAPMSKTRQTAPNRARALRGLLMKVLRFSG